MAFFLIGASLILIVGWMFFDPYQSKLKRWSVADTERDLMFRKFLELRDDPMMTSGKWREWLPVFEYMDEYYAANNHLDVKVASLADAVRKEIDPISLQGA